MKKIWIDITNSPHVIFFNPIIKELKANNYQIVVTARDYAQTKGLLDMFEIKYHMFGGHKGKKKLNKIWGLIERSWQLYKFVKKQKFDASLGMSSQYAMIVSKLLKIPHMTLSDYEYTSGHHMSFRLSKKILIPEGVEDSVLKKYGAKKENVIFYSGLKEQFYIHYYVKEYHQKYQENPLKDMLNIDQNKILIVIRPEATMAHYQSNKNDIIFELIEFLDNHEKQPIIIVLPRVKEQKEEYQAKKFKNVIIPEKVINGIDLVCSVDLVIGGGGTVNREAAAVGTPAYTIYTGGEFGAVDRMLISSGRMIKIEKKEDFKKIKIEKRKSLPNPVGDDFSKWYIDMVGDLIKEKK